MDLSCSVGFVDDQATVSLVGDIGVESTALMRSLIQTAFARPEITTVVVDLAGVTFLDSSALGVLIAARRSSVERGTTFGIQNPGSMVTMALEITGLYDELILDSADSADSAVSFGDIGEAGGAAELSARALTPSP